MPNGLIAPAQVASQKGFTDSEEAEVVFRPRKAMSFIRIKHVGNRNFLLAHSFHNLVRLSLLDPWVVGTLPNKKGLADSINMG